MLCSQRMTLTVTHVLITPLPFVHCQSGQNITLTNILVHEKVFKKLVAEFMQYLQWIFMLLRGLSLTFLRPLEIFCQKVVHSVTIMSNCSLLRNKLTI